MAAGNRGRFLPGAQDPRRGVGKAKHSGPKCQEFTDRARKLAEDNKLLDIAVMIARADIGEITVDRRGEPIYSKTKNSDRLRAIETVLAYAYGKPNVMVIHANDPDNPLNDPATQPHRVVVYELPDNGRRR
jgi:hypothetical protein